MHKKNKTHYLPSKLLSLFLFIGLFPLAFYGIFHLYAGMFDIGIILLINAVFVSLVLFKHQFSEKVTWQLDTVVFGICISIVYVSYILGIRGLIFIFPFIVGIFFNYSLRFAMWVSCLFSLAALTASLNILNLSIVVKVSIPAVMTIMTAFLYAKTIKRHRDALTLEANLDYLTGIYNRRSITSWLSLKIKDVSEHSLLALYFIDVDDFKRVNDSYGHAIGDRLLIEISQCLIVATQSAEVKALKLQSKVARLAGDEFAVVLSGIKSETEVQLFADKLLEQFNEQVIIDDIKINVHTSIGIAVTQDATIEPDVLLNYADIAMFEAKKQGKNRVGYFNQKVADKINYKNNMAQALRDSLEADLFYLHFMPIYDSTATHIMGAEALIRNDHKVLFGVGPETYIQVAEEYGLITGIDLFVIGRCFQYLQSILSDLEQKTFILAINISALELKNEFFPRQVEQLAIQYSIPPSMVEFEITETSLVDHDEKSIAVLQCLKDMGYQLSLDDFGTGYTAFNQLQHYPVDTLKIDRSFIWAIDPNHNNEGLMIDVILSLAKLYKLNVIAEGVEEPYQLEYLKRLNCSQYQGYLLCKPISWDAFIGRLNLGEINDNEQQQLAKP